MRSEELTLRDSGTVRWSPHPPQAVPLPLEGKDKNALVKGSAFFHCGNASLAGVWKCRARHCKSSLNLDRAIVLPLEGKGDRSAVVELYPQK